MKKWLFLGLGIAIGICLPIGLVAFLIIMGIRAFRHYQALDTSGTRVLAEVTAVKPIKSKILDRTNRFKQTPITLHRLTARWLRPENGKTYTFQSMISHPEKYAIGDEVAFVVDAQHPRYFRLADPQEANPWKSATTEQR